MPQTILFLDDDEAEKLTYFAKGVGLSKSEAMRKLIALCDMDVLIKLYKKKYKQEGEK